MCSAVAICKPWQTSDDFHICLGMRTRDGDKVVGPPGCKHAICRRKGNLAGFRKTGSDGNKILLGHPDIEKSIGERIAKELDVGILAKICRESDDLRLGPRDLDQCLAERRIDGCRRLALLLAHRQRAAAISHGPSPILLKAHPIRRDPRARSGPARGLPELARLCRARF